MVLRKNCAFNSYSRDKNNTNLFNKFQSPQAHLKTLIEESNQNYYLRLSNKILDGKTSPRLYWSILKTFLNNEFVTMANLSNTLRKKLNSLMTSLQGSVLLLITAVNFHLFLIKKHSSYFWQVSFQYMIS